MTDSPHDQPSVLGNALAQIPAVRGIVEKYGPDRVRWPARTADGRSSGNSTPSGAASSDDACPHCHGVGYFRSKAAFGEPQFGRAEACMVCDGYGTVNRYALALREECGIPDTLWHEFQFASYDPGRIPQGYAARDATELWAWATPETPCDKPFLALLGTVGLGKTHLACAAVQALIARRQRAVFVTVPRLLEELRAAVRPGAAADLDTVRARYESVPYLVLDDLGADRVTDFAAEQLYLVIDHRWQRRLPLLVTSNTAPEAIEPRVRSRILDSRLSRVVPLSGPDQRLVGGA